MSIVKLCQLQPGQVGKVVKIIASGELGRRIRDLGLLPEVGVEMLNKAPLRDPMALRVAGLTLSLRMSEADYVLVEVAC